MDAAGRMGRGTRKAGRMCGLRRKALVVFAVVACGVFLATAYAANFRRGNQPDLLQSRLVPPVINENSGVVLKHRIDTGQFSPAKQRHHEGDGRAGTVDVAIDAIEQKVDDATDQETASENTPLTRAVSSLNLAPGETLIALTFSDVKMLAMVVNWSVHLKQKNVPHLVGALDEETAKALTEQNIKNFRVILADAQLDAGSSHGSDNWKRFAVRRIAEVRNLLELGYDVLMSDADVVWVNDPRPYLQCDGRTDAVTVETTDAVPAGTTDAVTVGTTDVVTAGTTDVVTAGTTDAVTVGTTDSTGDTSGKNPPHPCVAIAAADVMVSSDNLSPKTDAKEGASYARGGVFNTGVVFLKHTRDAKAFAKAWHHFLSATHGTEHRFARLTSDQQVFNAMIRREGQWPGLELLVRHGNKGEKDYPTRVLIASLGGEKFDGVESFNLGVLPVATFQPGHVGFLQRVNEMDAELFRNVWSGSDDESTEELSVELNNPEGQNRKDDKNPAGLTPYCVHATYTFDGSTSVAKQLRFAEVGLWSAEAGDVAFREMTGKENSILHEDTRNDTRKDTRYLTYDASHSIGSLDVDLTEPNIGAHLRLGSAQIENLRDAIAVAKVLKRTLAIPRPFCLCDKVWGGHDNIFNFGCHYPGSQDSHHVPGACPLDHFISPVELTKQGVVFVSLAELGSFRVRGDDITHVVSGLDSVGADDDADGRGGASGSGSSGSETVTSVTKQPLRTVFLPHLASSDEVLRALLPIDTKVISLSNAFQAFGGFADVREAEAFNENIVEKALAPQQWCSECHPQGCVNLIDTETLKLGTLIPVRQVHDQFCATFAKPGPVGVAGRSGTSEAKEKTTVGEEKKKTEKKTPSTFLADDDGPGSPPFDGELVAAGW